VKERQANIVKGSLFLVANSYYMKATLRRSNSCTGLLLDFDYWNLVHTHRAILSGQLENTDLTSSGYTGKCNVTMAFIGRVLSCE